MKFEHAFSGAPWEARVGYCRALRAGNRPPATTMVEVKSLIHPDMLIEADADALIG